MFSIIFCYKKLSPSYRKKKTDNSMAANREWRLYPTSYGELKRRHCCAAEMHEKISENDDWNKKKQKHLQWVKYSGRWQLSFCPFTRFYRIKRWAIVRKRSRQAIFNGGDRSRKSSVFSNDQHDKVICSPYIRLSIILRKWKLHFVIWSSSVNMTIF